MKRYLAALAAAVLLCVPVALAASLNVSPGAVTAFDAITSASTDRVLVVPMSVDTYVDQAAPATAHGSDTRLRVTSAAAADARILLTAALPALPAGAVVARAELRLPTSGAARTLDAAPATASWSAATTWATQPTAGAVTASSSTSTGTARFTVTSDVAAGYAAPATWYGWRLSDSSESSATAATVTAPSMDGSDTASGPRLLIAYRVMLRTATTTPVAAMYGLRQLSSAYAGPLVALRRSSDNATSAFSAGSTGLLDMAAVTAWAPSPQSVYVTTWYDQSGNGRNLAQATASKQPTLIVAGTRQPGLLFTGAAADQSLTMAATLGITGTSSYMYLMALRALPASTGGGASDGSGSYFIDRTSATNNLASLKLITVTGVRYWAYQKRNDTGGNLGAAQATAGIDTTRMTVVGMERVFGTGYRLWVDGSNVATNTTGPSDTLTPPPLKLGAHATSNVSSESQVLELVVLNGSVSTADRQRLEGEMAWFAGSATSLAAGHPYKAAPP